MYTVIIGILCVLLKTVPLHAVQHEGALRLPNLISDHMVMQADQPIHLWGWAAPGESISLRLGSNAPVRVVADQDGLWNAVLDSMSAGWEPLQLVVQGQQARLTVEDILVGEVWFCSGQSNMGWSIRGSDHADRFLADADVPGVRLFTIGHVSASAEVDDVRGRWAPCTPETLGDFSAVAYHMGRDLHEQLDVPVGLIHSSWGGSRAEAWMHPETLGATDPGRDLQQRWQILHREFSIDPAMRAGKQIDDSAWLEGAVGGHFESFGLDDGVNGLFWQRIPVSIPEQWAGNDLVVSLGMIDDDDVTYFNGHSIGQTRGWRTPRRYQIPGDLVQPGHNMIAIRITDGSGPGGLHGDPEQFHLHLAADPAQRVLLEGPSRLLVAAETSDIPRQHRPSHLYNGMLEPVFKFPISGVAWYQGENNAIGDGAASDYEILLPKMIDDWREGWNREDLPFLVVQLPNWAHGEQTWDYPGVREVQRMTSLAHDATGLVVTIDVGDPGDIHPGNKHDVGRRLARMVLADVHGRPVVRSGPSLDSIKAMPGLHEFVVTFDTHGSSLEGRGGQCLVHGFQVSDSQGRFHDTNGAIVSADMVHVSLPCEVESIDARTILRYGWKPDPGFRHVPCDGSHSLLPGLFNIEGMPASPFQASIQQGSG